MTVTIENLYTGNGSTTDYSFTFPYLDTSDIKVSIGGNDTTAYSLLNATTVRFDSAPANSSALRIYRSTAYDSPKATFYPGSAIRSNDLNDNSLQNLYVTQEANVDILNSWKKGDPTIQSGETWASNNTQIATTGAVDGRIDAKANTKLTDDLIGGTDIAIADNNNAGSSATGKFTINHDVSGANSTVNNSNGNVLQDITISAQGHVTAIGSTNLDDRYYTETEVDANFYKLGSVAEIQSGETWSAADNKIATTSAIDARIIDLVDDVGGFVPIANETSFPNANPDVNNGAGTLVSIKALASNLTSNGSGVATIANGNAASDATITINGLANSTTYAAGFGMIVETTTSLHTYTFHRQSPKATEVTTVAGAVSNVNTVAGAISNVNTVAAANSNISTVAGSISNVNTAAGSISNINTVASNISGVNDFADRYRVASSAPGSDNDAGDLYFNTSSNELQVYNGSAWQGGVTATGDLMPKSGGIFTGDVTFTGDASNGLWDRSANVFVANVTGNVTGNLTGNVTGNTSGSSGSCTGNSATATTATNVTVADESTDTSCNVLFTTAATGDLPPKSGTNLTFNSNTGILTATGFAGDITGNVTGNTSGSAGSCTGNSATATTATNVTVADESSDTSCNVLFTTAATGDLPPKSGTNLTFNSSTGDLTATILTDGKGNVRSIPQNSQGSTYTLVAADAGKHILASGAITIPDGVFAVGDVITIINNTGSDLAINKGTTLYYTADATNANRTLASRGMATLIFAAANTAYISGSGLS